MIVQTEAIMSSYAHGLIVISQVTNHLVDSFFSDQFYDYVKYEASRQNKLLGDNLIKKNCASSM